MVSSFVTPSFMSTPAMFLAPTHDPTAVQLACKAAPLRNDFKDLRATVLGTHQNRSRRFLASPPSAGYLHSHGAS